MFCLPCFDCLLKDGSRLTGFKGQKKGYINLDLNLFRLYIYI